MTAIILHGRLKRDFGGSFDLQVNSAAQAVRHLVELIPGFRAAMRDGYYRIVYGPKQAVTHGRPVAGFELSEAELRMRTGAEAIHIIPAAAGAGRGGAGKAILGAVIVAVAVVLAMPSGGASLAALGSGLTTAAGGLSVYGSIAMFGATMMIAGISQMLSPMPKAPTATETEKTNSFLLGGQLNIYEQGGPMPLVYGRYRVGSTLISAGLDTAILMNGGLATPVGASAIGGVNFPEVTGPGSLITSSPVYGPITVKPSAESVTGFQISAISGGTLTKAGGEHLSDGAVLSLGEGAAGVTFTAPRLAPSADTPSCWDDYPTFQVTQVNAGGGAVGITVTFGGRGSWTTDPGGGAGPSGHGDGTSSDGFGGPNGDAGIGGPGGFA